MYVKQRLVAAAFLLTVFVPAGCGGGSNTAVVCNALVDDGPAVTPTVVSTTPPTPTGGTMVDGTYALTALTIYTGSGASASPPSGIFSVVYEITGNVAQSVGRINGSEVRATSTFTISGTTLSSVDTCPETGSGTHSLTATPTEWRTYDSAAQGTLEQVYTKR